MIYLDHHATTPVLPEVWEAMRPFATEVYGNPSSAHAVGRKARQALEDARERIAQHLGAFPDEVIFTSGATEANNLAIFGLAGEPPGHILASLIEHPCVIEPLKQLAARGFEVEWIPVQPNGSVSVDTIAQSIRPDTRLIALMLVNHETGVIQPVNSAACGLACHTDAAQAVGKRPVHFHDLGVVSLSASGHKFGVPKGVGLLLLKRGVKLQPMLFGGHQQQGRRPGTEPVALAVGMALALEISLSRWREADAHVSRLRSRLVNRLIVEAPPCVLNSSNDDSPSTNHLPNGGSPYVVNISFPGCRAELLLMKLDLMGVACSTGSACSSGSLLPSPVLKAMGVPDDVLRSAMRFSFSSKLSEADIDSAAERIIKCVNELRRETV